MEDGIHPLTIELIDWISRHSANYGELMEVWRTSCPRHSTWEDARIAGLVEVVGDKVTLTEQGRAVLDASAKNRTDPPSDRAQKTS